MKKSFVRGTWQRQARVLAGRHHRRRAAHPLGRRPYRQVDDNGKSLAGDFDAQFQQTFRNIEKTLAEAGATLADLVTMTVFLIDARHTTRMTELRGELFGKDFPASAAITVAGLRPARNDDRGAGYRRDGIISASAEAGGMLGASPLPLAGEG